MKDDISRKEYAERINKALDFINNNLSEELNLESLSTAACFSPFHFHRIFTALVNETPRDYTERLRLERAANHLFTRPQKSIAEIALKCGFSSQSAFSRSFKKYYKVTAKEFTKKHIKDFHMLNESNKNFIVSKDFDNSKIKIKNLPAFHLAFSRSMEGYGKGIPKAWEKLYKFADAYDLLNENTFYIGIPLDNPGITPDIKCRYQACITIPDGISVKGEIGIKDITGGKYAVYSFIGEVKEISQAYSEIYGIWLPDSGYIPDDKETLELYQKGLRSNCTNNILKYEICIPIKPL